MSHTFKTHTSVQTMLHSKAGSAFKKNKRNNFKNYFMHNKNHSACISESSLLVFRVKLFWTLLSTWTINFAFRRLDYRHQADSEQSSKMLYRNWDFIWKFSYSCSLPLSGLGLQQVSQQSQDLWRAGRQIAVPFSLQAILPGPLGSFAEFLLHDAQKFGSKP